jgi:hypothetical protein
MRLHSRSAMMLAKDASCSTVHVLEMMFSDIFLLFFFRTGWTTLGHDTDCSRQISKKNL